ncbi:MAG: hypothetical protein L3J65_09365 [Robiginitomaculum sp.]|nr:hypothetical protein [Robiginitomaculum sp.]
MSTVVFVGLLVALYSIKAHTLAAKAKVATFEQALISEKQAIQMLSAEIAHLESPERLRVLASKQLNLQPTPASRTMTLAQVAQVIAQKPLSETTPKTGGAQ